MSEKNEIKSIRNLIYFSIKEIIESNKFKAFLWTSFNWCIAIILKFLWDLPYESIPVIVAILNYVTKELNRTYNPNFDKTVQEKEI